MKYNVLSINKVIGKVDRHGLSWSITHSAIGKYRIRKKYKKTNCSDYVYSLDIKVVSNSIDKLYYETALKTEIPKKLPYPSEIMFYDTFDKTLENILLRNVINYEELVIPNIYKSPIKHIVSLVNQCIIFVKSLIPFQRVWLISDNTSLDKENNHITWRNILCFSPILYSYEGNVNELEESIIDAVIEGDWEYMKDLFSRVEIIDILLAITKQGKDIVKLEKFDRLLYIDTSQ